MDNVCPKPICESVTESLSALISFPLDYKKEGKKH